MSRKIIIEKYQGNTHYTVKVIDSFGQEHHIGFYSLSPMIDRKSEEIWSNEVKREITPMEKAIKWCVDNDTSKGREPSLD